MASQQLLLGAGGVPKKTYIDDVWRCMPYRGNGSSTTRTIKGPKMSDGGLTIFKRRDGSGDGWRVLNTVRGNTKLMYAHSSSQENTVGVGQYGGLGWTNSGVNIATTDSALNADGGQYVCYNWKKQKNFFDIVEYEGNGSTTTGSNARAIAHNLGATPGMIWIKNCDDTGHWTVYHRYNDGSPGGSANGHNYEMKLDTEDIRAGTDHFGDKAPTSTHFYVASDGNAPDDVNENGDTYIAFVFASHHDNSGTFGIDDNQNICAAGIYMGNGSNDGPELDIGWIPQHIFIKARAVSGQNWNIFDTMRGMSFDGDQDEWLKYDSHGSTTMSTRIDISNETSFTGFKIVSDSDSVNKNSEEYLYYAIRGHDGKVTPPIEAGSEFLSLKMGSSNTGAAGSSSPYFPDQPTYESALTGGSKRIDYAWVKDKTTVSSWWVIGRDISGKRQNFENGSDVDASTNSSDFDWSFENGFNDGGGASNWMSWGWQKSDCFDMFNYEGSESTASYKHNLGSTPTLILVQALNTGLRPMFRWGGNHASDEYITTDDDGERDDLTSPGHPWGNAPTSTHVYLGNNARTNHIANHYRMCLWADKAGVQKAGTYTGDGTSNQTITLGFQPRFIMIMKENGGCNWRMFDTVSGWGSGSDHHWAFNQKDGGFSTTYNFGAPTSNGFNIDAYDSCHNSNGDKYFYLATA